MGNKVLFGFSNVHYALIKSVGEDGVPVYDIPKKIPGAVSYSPEASSEESPFHADNIIYYMASQSSGYSGDLEMAKFPDEFLVDVLGWIYDDKGALVEASNSTQKSFALIGAVDGDDKGRKFVFYNCTGGTPSRAMNTTAGAKEPVTETMTVSSIPVILGLKLEGVDLYVTKASLEYTPEQLAVWQSFETAVYIPTLTSLPAGAPMSAPASAPLDSLKTAKIAKTASKEAK